MKVKGLSFSPEMVTALLDGRKTQTRRVLKQQPLPDWDYQGLSSRDQPRFYQSDRFRIGSDKWEKEYEKWDGLLPKLLYKPGDLIYVREGLERGLRERNPTCYYQATGTTDVRTGVPAPNYAQGDISGRALWLWKGNKLNPSQMPRWASRLTLEVNAVKIEQLQDISEEDAGAEGVNTDVKDYRALWEMRHGKASWDANPWVIATSFTVIQQNIDEV